MRRLNPARIPLYVWLLAAAFVAVLVAAAAGLLWNMRATALRSSEQLAEHILSDVEASLNRNLLSIDLLLSGVQDLLSLQPTADAQSDSRMLSLISRDNLLVGRLAVLDVQGRVHAASGSGGVQQDFALPPDFLAAAAVSSVQRLHISAAARSFATAQQVLYFARPMQGRDGPRWVVAEVPLAKMSHGARGTTCRAWRSCSKRMTASACWPCPTCRRGRRGKREPLSMPPPRRPGERRRA